MKVTNISIQAKNPDRVNVLIDGKYRFSLDVYQVGDLGIKVGRDYTEEELQEFETESRFGKLYSRALEYMLMRPHSARELKDYLWRKTRPTKRKDGSMAEGVSTQITDRVFNRLTERGYVNDQRFAQWWIENRNLNKGTSKRKLMNELRVKGVEPSVIEPLLESSERTDGEELLKVIEKKRKRYDDEQKLVHYLMRQGFRYDDIVSALRSIDD
jgi:regulatory protein